MLNGYADSPTGLCVLRASIACVILGVIVLLALRLASVV